MRERKHVNPVLANVSWGIDWELTRQVLEKVINTKCNHLAEGETYQQPVLDRGGKRMRGGAMRPFSNLLTDSSLGAMMGSRSGRFPEALARRFCITRLVTVIRLTGCLG